jgi:uncharacterized protein YggE
MAPSSSSSSTFTVGVRGLVVTAALSAVAVTGLTAAYTVGAARADEPATQPVSTVAATPETSAQSGAVVRGEGTATGVPDQIRISLAANATADDVSAALAETNRAAHRVLRTLREHDVDRRDVQTTGLSLHPVYDYSDEGPPQITGYAASQRFSVLLRDLRTGGAAIGAAVTAGGDAVRLSGVRLQIGDEAALLREARAAAFADARAKAEQYAAASGRELGEVVTVREGVSRQRSVLPDFGLARSALDVAKVPIRAGSEEVTVRVSLVWAFA